MRGAESAAPPAREIDVTKVMLSGLPAAGTIKGLRRLSELEDVQQRFIFELAVEPAEGEAFTATAEQAVAEDYLPLAAIGQQVRLKCDPDDPELVWIDWAGSSSS